MGIRGVLVVVGWVLVVVFPGKCSFTRAFRVASGVFVRVLFDFTYPTVWVFILFWTSLDIRLADLGEFVSEINCFQLSLLAVLVLCQ